jgi:hypothetical protein
MPVADIKIRIIIFGTPLLTATVKWTTLTLLSIVIKLKLNR